MALYNSSGKALQKTLYENTTGTTGTVTLSDSSANYQYLEIFYQNSTKAGTGSVKVYSPNGKGIDMMLSSTASGNNIYIVMCRANISGNKITPSTYSTNHWSGSDLSIDKTNGVYIYRVIGYN